jgi:hypothetical protein
MKKLLLLLSATVLCLPLSGQVLRLTASDNAFLMGDVVVKQQVEYRDAGSHGHGIIWDFAFLQPINEQYEVKYFYPDSTDFSLICGREPSARFYYRLQNDTLKSVGFENNTSIMNYFLPEVKLKFPFNFGDTLRSNFAGAGQYGRRVNMSVSGYTSTIYDADGTLKIPDFPDGVPALRTHSQRFYTQATRDSLQMKIDTWSWYVAGTRYPVFESIQTSVVSNTTFANGSQQQNDTAIFQTSFYYPPTQQTNIYAEQNAENQILTGINAVFTEADWQPNPVVENLYISYKLTRNATVWFSVHNNGSISLCQTPPQHLQAGYNQTIIPMNALISGTYTVYVHVDDMVLMQTVIKR